MSRRKNKREEDRRILLQEMLQASDQQIRQAAEEAAQQAAVGLSAEVRDKLAIYLMQVPAMARQSLRRPETPPAPRSPAGHAFSRPEDVLPLLPTRTPRFKVGDRPLPGVDWELEQLLGVGGFGEVWKARNPRFGSVAPVALKFCLDQNAKERLLHHEAAVLDQVMSQGHHPGIVAFEAHVPECRPAVSGIRIRARRRPGNADSEMAPKEIARLGPSLSAGDDRSGENHRFRPPTQARRRSPRSEAGQHSFAAASCRHERSARCGLRNWRRGGQTSA